MMPKRTNEFQQILQMIQRAVAPGSKVTESAMVEVPGLRTMREVDILVESNVGPYAIKVAVEAKDKNRPLDVVELESLIAKYRGEGRVRVDKVVLVTRSGFTTGASEKAALLDIELFTLRQAIDLDWKFLKPKTLRFTHPPHLCQISVSPELPAAKSAAIVKSGQVYCSHGTCHGSVRSMVMSYIGGLALQRPSFLLELQTFATRKGQGTANIAIRLNHEHFIRFGTERYRLEKIDFKIHAVDATAETKCKAVTFAKEDGEPKEFLYFESSMAGRTFQFLLPNEETPQQIQVSVKPLTPATAESAAKPATALLKSE